MGAFKAKEDYLKELCIAHPLVQHTVDGRKSFFRINGDDELTAGFFDKINFPCVANMSFSGNIKDTDSAMIAPKYVIRSEWLFITSVKLFKQDGAGFTDRIQSAYDITFQIMEDFIKTMMEEFEENGSCGAFQHFDLNKINFQQVGPILEHEYGWSMSFEDEVAAARLIS